MKMTVAKLIEELESTFDSSEPLQFLYNDVYTDSKDVTFSYNPIPTIELPSTEDECWECIADGYRSCLCELLEICDDDKLSNVKKIEAIRTRLNIEI